MLAKIICLLALFDCEGLQSPGNPIAAPPGYCSHMNRTRSADVEFKKRHYTKDNYIIFLSQYQEHSKVIRGETGNKV